jgi:hypothetical protein
VYEQARNRPPDARVIAAMADVPQEKKRVPRHLRAA